jgi:hypothetical protein
MRIDANADNGQWQWAARNATASAKPETAIDREQDGDTDDVKKAAVQPAQKAQAIAPTDEDTGTKVNLLA